MPKAVDAGQPVERDQATARGWMLAGAKGGCRVDRDPDRAGRDAAPMVRAIDKKAADPQWRERQLVFRQPVALRQFLLADRDKLAAGGSGGQSQLRRQLRGE